jgi:hypothetical protein
LSNILVLHLFKRVTREYVNHIFKRATREPYRNYCC